MKSIKKLLAVLLVCALAIPVYTSTVNAASLADVKLPFTLEAPKYTALKWLEGHDSATTMQFTYSMNESMIAYLQSGDLGTKADKLKEAGYNPDTDAVWFSAQVDWAIDDPTNGWHYNKYWDGSDGKYEPGKDENLRNKLGDWDTFLTLFGAQTTNEAWIFRGIMGMEYSDKDDPNYSASWYGSDDNPGLKNQLKEGQYEIRTNSEGEQYLAIDYTQHTVYTRMRYYATVQKYNSVTDTTDEFYVFSDWSPVAAYGKDAQPADITSASLPVPATSGLTVTTESFNDNPVISYNLAVPDSLAKLQTEAVALGGVIFIQVQGRIQGHTAWIELQGDRDLKTGVLKSDLVSIADAQYGAVNGDNNIEIRMRYWCSLYNKYGSYDHDAYSEWTVPQLITAKLKVAGAAAPSDTGTGSTVVNEPAIKSLDGGASYNQVKQFVTGLKTDNDPKGSTFSFLFGRQKKATKNAITITWLKPKNASYYVIYGNKCGKKNHYAQITSVKGNSYTQKSLAKGTYYKYLVAAFDKNDKLLGVSNTIHITTDGGKYTNFKKVTTAAKKNKVTLDKKTKTFKLKAKAILASAKQGVDVHRPLRYETSNKKVATVDKSGKIKAVKKGNCFIYAYAQNGAYCKVKVTVK